MAMNTRETLVQRGVSVVLGGQTAWMRTVCVDTAYGKAPAFPISMRHPSQGRHNPSAPRSRQARANDFGAAQAALRAGRSEGLAGVLVSGSRASRSSFVSRRPLTLGTRLSRAGSLSLPRVMRAGKRLKAPMASLTLAGRTRFAASTRGRGAV